VFVTNLRLWHRANGDHEQNKIVCYVCGVEVEHFVTIDLAEWYRHHGLFRSSIVRGEDCAVMNLCQPCFGKLPEDIYDRIINFIRSLIEE
jgi:hypothetical protein